MARARSGVGLGRHVDNAAATPREGRARVPCRGPIQRGASSTTFGGSSSSRQRGVGDDGQRQKDNR